MPGASSELDELGTDLPMHRDDPGLADLVVLCPPTNCPLFEIHIPPAEVQDAASRRPVRHAKMIMARR